MISYLTIKKRQSMSMSKRNISFTEAIREAVFQSIKKDKNLFLMGEGVDDPSSMWGTIKGVKRKFGKSKTIEMPVSENGMIGVAIGSAINGSKVLVNLQRVEFALYAFEQIINNAAKTSYISRGKHSVPIVIRMVIGRGWGQGPEHGQSLENIFSAIPGLKVVIPAFPEEAKSMLIASIFDPNPVIFLEHRWSHFTRGKVDKKFKIKKLKSFNKITTGSKLTLVANSVNVLECLRVSKLLKKYYIDIDLFNLCMPNPLDLTEVIRSVKKTKRLITIDLSHKRLGVGAEIIASILENKIDLKSPPVRLGLPFHPVPSSRGLVKNFYPTGHEILNSIKESLKIDKIKFSKILNEYNLNTKKLPIDVPDPYFKGPF
jgi:acetoin:2,6-dichlorophenolindophenol oxidoreductase subunit beta